MKRTNVITKYLLALLFAVLAILTLTLIFIYSLRVFTTVEKERGEARLVLYENTIRNELTRLLHLPDVLADGNEVVGALATLNAAELNKTFKLVSKKASAEAIYLMSPNGLTIAASNFDQPHSFIGQNYGFRPYFQKAMRGGNPTFFAIGATTSRPGFFLATPVVDNTNVIGVLAVKLDLTALNGILETTNDHVLVVNSDGIVVLSSKPDLLYKTISAISTKRLDEISQEQQFGSTVIKALDWSDFGNDEISLNATTYFTNQAPLNEGRWRLIYLGSLNEAKQRALGVVTTVAILITLSILAVVALRSQKLRRALAESQQSRKRLQREITVRREAETRLQNAQSELQRTSKMAALGQLAASITHELGQPISAMKNHIAAEEIAQKGSKPILTILSGILRRMEGITQQLRFFATPSNDRSEKVDLNDVMKSAISLISHNIERDGIDLKVTLGSDDCCVLGNQQRLEQVVINLLQNSIKAMSDSNERTLLVTLSNDCDTVNIQVKDTGSGLNGQSLEQLVEPFHTSGPSGEGMGLGLAISEAIVQEHSGTLAANDCEGGGAVFEVSLPKDK